MTTFLSYSKRFARPLWGWYLAGFFALAAVNVITLEVPELAKQVINAITEGRDLDQAKGVALLIVALGLLMMFMRALSRILIFWPARKLETTTKSHLFKKTLGLPLEWFISRGMGDVISRIANDVGQIRVFYAFGLLQALNVLFLLLLTITRMASTHLVLTVLAMLPLGIMAVITRVTIPKMHRFSRENQDSLGRLTNRVTESFVNVHVIQANAAGDSFLAQAKVENEKVFETNMKLVAIRTLLFPLMVCLAGLSQLIVLFYGGYEVISGDLSVGDILAFNVYIGLLTFPLTALGIIISTYQRAKTALDRIGDIEVAPAETVLHPLQTVGGTADSSQKQGPRSFPGAHTDHAYAAPLLTVKNLVFSFEDILERPSNARPFKLGRMDFQIPCGKHMGIFGRVGSGKSTVFNLITRLFNPPPGTIFWKGQDVLEIPPRELRRDIGYALQSVHLFSDSIAENLKFGMERNDISQEELDEAARKAQILDEIRSFNHGWNTQIGERGVRLSGGQKQRLALARLFLRKYELLLLDDVLSAVDQTTETRLIQEIKALDVSMIIASHRGSVLQHCHEILIMEHGQIVDRGTFDELVLRYPDLTPD